MPVQSKPLGLQGFLQRGKRNADYVIEKQNILKPYLQIVANLQLRADHVFSTNHSIKWDHFEILATGRSDMHCKIKDSLLIRDLKPALNENVGSEKLHLYY